MSYIVESLADFLIGEGKLESYLEEHPPLETNVNQAKLGLLEAKRYLQHVTGEEGIRVSIKKVKQMRVVNLFC